MKILSKACQSRAIKLLLGGLVFSLAGCGQYPKVVSSTETLNQTEPRIAPENKLAAQWRAVNRLNYGPTPAVLVAV